MKTKLITLILIAIPILSLFSQSNEELDRFLNQEYADLATTAWLIYLSAEEMPLDAMPRDVMDEVVKSKHAGWFINRNNDDPVTYGVFALLMMDIYDLPGGLMYNILPTPRYAAREFSYRRWMPGDRKPGSLLTPWDVTSSISQVLAWKEVNK